MFVALCFVIAAVAVVVLGLVVVGRETASLASQPTQTVFDLEEAVLYVGDRLPEEITAKITYDDVRSVLRWHLEYLRARGVPIRRDLAARKIAPVVVEDDEGIAFVLGRCEAAGIDLTDLDVAHIVETAMAYLWEIGAVGGPADQSLLLAQMDEADALIGAAPVPLAELPPPPPLHTEADGPVAPEAADPSAGSQDTPAQH